MEARLAWPTRGLDQLRNEALACLERGDLEGGRTLLEAVVALGEDDAAIYLLLAGCCHQLDDLEAAKDYFRRGIDLSHAIGDDELKESALLWGGPFLKGALAFDGDE